VVLGVDSLRVDDGWQVFRYTGDPDRMEGTPRDTRNWIVEAQERGAGEVVLNCMNSDGVRNGYDLEQLTVMLESCAVPLVASGGAGSLQHFVDVFENTHVSAALAASVFHSGEIAIPDLKRHLQRSGLEVRL
jgi:cyclase